MKFYSISILLLLLILYSSICAQDDLKQWLKEEQEAFREFLSEEDKAFMEFLEQEWEEYQLSQGLELYGEPKPLKLPVYEPVENRQEESGAEGKMIEQIPELPEEPEKLDSKETLTPLEEKEIINKFFDAEEERGVDYGTSLVDPRRNPVELKLNFYGASKQININIDLEVNLEDDPDGKSISTFWGKLSTRNYKDFLKQTLYYKKHMNLNDWGYCLLLNGLANDIYGDSKNDKNLFLWFVLNKSGYKAKVGIIDDNVHLFIPTSNRLYGIQYFSMKHKNERLYVIDFDNLGSAISGDLFTYEKDYEGAERNIDMNVYKPMMIDEKVNTKVLKFEYEGTAYNVPVKFNISDISFYKNYPYSNLEVYFNAAVNGETYFSLLSSLDSIVAGMTQAQAANRLLRFCQTAFTYEPDQPHFGREKPLFLEETIYYSKSDCEDRSILFAFLVKNLLDLKVVAITYPGHCATAVNFTEDVGGDYIKYKGDKYVICDPTYINAIAGMTMTKYRTVKIDKIYKLN